MRFLDGGRILSILLGVVMFLHKGACPDMQAQSSYPKMPAGQVSQSECTKMNLGRGVAQWKGTC